jgi:hypothetical protein
MNRRLYKSTREIEGAVLQEGDQVQFSFRQGPPITYIVNKSCLIIDRSHSNSNTVFLILNVPPKTTAMECYGYKAGPGPWPTCNPGDFEALTRLVKRLFIHAESDFLRAGDSFVQGYNEKRRLEMTGATLPPRPELQYKTVKKILPDGKASLEKETVVLFCNKEYTFDEWSALQNLHQHSRLVGVNGEPPVAESIPYTPSILETKAISITSTEQTKFNYNIHKPKNDEHRIIIVRTASATIASGQGPRRVAISCGGNSTRIAQPKNRNKKGAFKS